MNENIDSKLNLESESSTVLSSNIVINRVKELYRKGEITLEEVKGEASGMILGAFETTALTVNHTLILLAMFPHHQELVFEELKEVFPAGGDFEVEYEDLQKLVYLDRVLNETLRLLPAVPISLRDVKEDLRLSNGVLVPKGVIMGIDIFNIHRNRDLWGHNADAFDPDRFLPDNIRQRHPYAFIPYSKGKRNCIGWRYAQISLKIALAKIVRNYSLRTSFWYEDLSFLDNVVIKLDKGPLLNFNRRTT
nr:probable cytochrome P450 313a3 [Drosophila bipectinata]